jgi:hypothetical protein
MCGLFYHKEDIKMAGKMKKFLVNFPIKGTNGQKFKPGDTIELEVGHPITEDFLDRGIITDGKRGLKPSTGMAQPRIGTTRRDAPAPKQLVEDPAENPITQPKSDVDKQIEGMVAVKGEDAKDEE